jgi:hypothetical protein
MLLHEVVYHLYDQPSSLNEDDDVMFHKSTEHTLYVFQHMHKTMVFYPSYQQP